jgi:hypothetical protein
MTFRPKALGRSSAPRFNINYIYSEYFYIIILLFSQGGRAAASLTSGVFGRRCLYIYSFFILYKFNNY